MQSLILEYFLRGHILLALQFSKCVHMMILFFSYPYHKITLMIK